MADIFELLKRKAQEQYAQGQPYRDLFFKGDPSGVLAKLEAWKNLPMDERVAQATDIGMGFAGTMKGVGKIDKLTGLPLNKDGTVTLYHHTNKDAAEKIFKTGRLQSAGEPDVYLTTQKINDTGYGDVVVPINIKPSLLNIDDEFPSGRLDFRVNVGKPKGSINVDAKAPLTKYENAQDIAQQNAALPVEKGGLGLPKNNTAMDRAKAMGFDVNNIEYHTTDAARIPSLYEHGFMNVDRGERNFKHLGKEYGGNRYYATGQGNYTSSNPFASWFTSQGKLGADKAMLPLVINKSKHFDFKNPSHVQDLMTPKENYQQVLGKAEMNPKDLKALQEGKHYLMEDWITLMNLKKRGYTGTNLVEPNQYYAGEGITTHTFNPSDIRSVNAAFDPFRRNEADILAGLLAVPATQLLEDDEDKKKRKTK